MTLDDFYKACAKSADKVHDTLMRQKDVNLHLGKPEKPEYYLAKLVALGVITPDHSARLSEMIDILMSGGDVVRIRDLHKEIANEANLSPVAVAISGVVVDSAMKASTPLLRSVAGDDVIGALLGGVSGAVAGEMVAGPKGAVAGGVFGAIVVGAIASIQAA